MPTLAPQGYNLDGSLRFGYPFVDDFQRRFDAIVAQNAGGAQGVAQRGAQGRANMSRSLGPFGPVGGPAGGTTGRGLTPPPQAPSPTGQARGPQSMLRGGGRGTNRSAPQGGRGVGPLLNSNRGGGGFI